MTSHSVSPGRLPLRRAKVASTISDRLGTLCKMSSQYCKTGSKAIERRFWTASVLPASERPRVLRVFELNFWITGLHYPRLVQITGICGRNVRGHLIPYFAMDFNTLAEILRVSGIANFELFIDDSLRAEILAHLERWDMFR